MMMKWTGLLALAAMLAVGGCTRGENANEPEAPGAHNVRGAELGNAPKVTRYGPIWFSGQPGEDDWEDVKSAGITKVIDLRNHDEPRGHDEGTVVEELGLEYEVHPVRSDGWSEQTVEPVLVAMTEAVESGDGVLVHCATSNRSGAVFAIWRHRQGDSVDEAIRKGKQAGLTSDEQPARDYIEQHGG